MRHQDRDVVVKAQYIDLKKKVATAMDFWFYIRTDARDTTFEVRVQMWGWQDEPMWARGLRWLAVAPLLLLGPTAPAVAETVVHKDARHDVERTTEGGDKQVLRRLANGDITRHRLTYAGGRLVTVIRFRELRKPARELWVEVPIRYRADGRIRYGEIELKVNHGGPQHPDAVYTASDLSSGCSVATKIDYGDNVVRMVLPADCIGTPQRLRAGVTAFYNRPFGGGIAFYLDAGASSWVPHGEP